MIYRIEHKVTRVGPYRMYGLMGSKKKNKILEDIILNISCPIKHPLPELKGNKNPLSSNMKYGFENLIQLFSWFSKETIEKLYKIGFIVVEYDGNLIKLDKQIAFDYDSSKLKKEYLIEEVIA